MANSTDILTRDENRVRIFAEGITIDETLPKYRIMEEKDTTATSLDDVSNLTSFPDYSTRSGSSITDLSSLNYETLKAYLIDEQNKDGKKGFSMTDFNITMSNKIRQIVKKTSFYRDGRTLADYTISSDSYIPRNPRPVTLWSTIKDFFREKKEFKEEKKVSDKFDVVKYFADVHMASKENSDKYVNRLAEYINCIGIAESTGQVALKEKLFGQLVINKYESILYANGYDKLITEDVMVKLTKKAPKALSLTYIANYTRTIPLDIIKKKLELDTLEIFDNYVVLHYDPNGKSYAQTVEERRKEVEKAKDPILFGVIDGSDKLYYIGDWEDEYCNLRLENVVDIVGQEEVTKHYLKEVIKQRFNIWDNNALLLLSRLFYLELWDIGDLFLSSSA